jgi:hypothetical protein
MCTEFGPNIEKPATGILLTLKTFSVIKSCVEYKPFALKIGQIVQDLQNSVRPLSCWTDKNEKKVR